MIHGKDLIVTTDIGGTQAAVAACKNCTLKVSQNFIDACSPTSGRTKKKIPTDYSWSVSCDFLLPNPQQALVFLEALKGGMELTLQFLALGFKQSGKAFIKDWDISGGVGNLATYKVSFEGSEGLATNAGWDFINGTLYTYSNFANGTLTVDGQVSEGTLAYVEPSES